MDDDWQPVTQAAPSEADDWQPVAQPAPKQVSPSDNRSAGENVFRQVGLAGRDLAGAIPGAVAGGIDLVDNLAMSGANASNKYLGTNIPTQGAFMPRSDMAGKSVQDTLNATGMFPKPENAVEEGVGGLTSMLFGGGENTVPTLKAMASNAMDMIPKRAAAYDPMAAMKGISDAFNGAIDKANTFYGFPQQLAEGRSVQAPQVKGYLDSVIDDVNNSPWHEAKSQVGTLQRIRDGLPDDGSVPVNDLLDLRKFTNKYFDPGRFTDKGATYGKLNSVVDTGLNTAKQSIPNFGKSLDIADNYWRNNVTAPFLDNKVLQKMWTPSDAHNLRMVDEGYLDEPGDLTKQRADNLVKNVKDVNSYNAVRRTLPDEVGPAFDSAVLQNMPTGRLQAAGKAISNTVTGHWPTALRNAADVINPDLTAAQKATIQAVKGQNTYTPLSQKNDFAQAAYENLVKAHMKGEGQPLALPPPAIAPAPVKGLPTPEEAAPQPQRAISNQFYAPDSRALTYQPRADFQVSPEGFAQHTPNAQTFEPKTSAEDLKPFEGAAAKATEATGRPRKMLTYQPRPDFSGAAGMAPGRSNPQPSSEFHLGESEGIPMGQGELDAIRRLKDIAGGFAKGGKVPSVSEWSRLLHKARKKGYNVSAKDRNDPATVARLMRIA